MTGRLRSLTDALSYGRLVMCGDLDATHAGSVVRKIHGEDVYGVLLWDVVVKQRARIVCRSKGGEDVVVEETGWQPPLSHSTVDTRKIAFVMECCGYNTIAIKARILGLHARTLASYLKGSYSAPPSRIMAMVDAWNAQRSGPPIVYDHETGVSLRVHPLTLAGA